MRMASAMPLRVSLPQADLRRVEMAFLNSYAVRHPLQGAAVNMLLLAALVLLLYGLQAPTLTLEKFWFFSNTVSLLSALQTLAQEAEWGLFALVGTFSVVFPILKILVLLLIWNFDVSQGEAHRRHLAWLATYSKWSMLDVFVVALLVVSVKLGSLAAARVEVGIYAFAASVIMTMLLSAWVGGHAVDPANEDPTAANRG
jgi:paraquat-inducible protein A